MQHGTVEAVAYSSLWSVDCGIADDIKYRHGHSILTVCVNTFAVSILELNTVCWMYQSIRSTTSATNSNYYWERSKSLIWKRNVIHRSSLRSKINIFVLNLICAVAHCDLPESGSADQQLYGVSASSIWHPMTYRPCNLVWNIQFGTRTCNSDSVNVYQHRQRRCSCCCGTHHFVCWLTADAEPRSEW